MSQGCRGCHKETYGCRKDITADIRIPYGSVTDIKYTSDPQTFYGKFKQFACGCHKDITDGTDVFTDEKCLP